MATSRKYGRTYHYPFSPGTTSDDRINHDWADDLFQIEGDLLHTEKLDGENNCLSRYGVFARSHATPTDSPWTSAIRQKWQQIRHELGDLEVFGENLFAIHSIRYEQIDNHFYVFGIREHERWLSWEETKFYAALLDFPTVPELALTRPPLVATAVQATVQELVSGPSRLVSVDAMTGLPCTMEGVVSRPLGDFSLTDFTNCVFKYVRKGHVKTDQHWTRNWQRAPLVWEKSSLPTGN